ncbi:FMN-binding glutamate synthase family protein [Gordonia westfalica]|uniref:Glutamate synthase domain-containing protein 2 n=1 Tax=Gordonia westfalica TaxID=158898 RepID=A0A1H2H5B2_9ACTN|nr:FMN-binding glutamate synthase family protein [Gordonia westfalica]SDU26983.1 Glutamate synthase domain-containing protein 2 [Gordonia westfalica]
MRRKRSAAVGAATTVAAVVVRDLFQREHSLLRNYPLVGHARYWIEALGPELRQYIVAANDEERPFTRDQRRWIYASSKKENNYFGFGTDNDVEFTNGYPVIKHRTFNPASAPASTPEAGHEVVLPSAKVMGEARGRPAAFRPESVVNISGMSFGALSGNAIEALNRGAALTGALHNTGEGGISPYHRHGGDLVFQIGTAYFGCRDAQGRFDLARLKDVVAEAPVRALEIKLSQGAKPCLGGFLPGPKVSAEIAATRGVPPGQDCVSPSRHAEFSDADSMLDWVELLAAETGLPVGIKSAVGDLHSWHQIADLMTNTGRGVDFISIDGGEGGTGAAPLLFSDSVSLPFLLGFTRIYRIFAERNLHEQITFIGSGKLGLPDNAVLAFALGCDMVNVAREAMLSVGCIQAQKCHTDTCPTGVATQKGWLTRGLVPDEKASRAANYITTLRRDLVKVSQACGVEHPGLITTDSVEIVDGRQDSRPLGDVYGYSPGMGLPSEADRAAVVRLMSGQSTGGSAPPSATSAG